MLNSATYQPRRLEPALFGVILLFTLLLLLDKHSDELGSQNVLENRQPSDALIEQHSEEIFTSCTF